jgi:hypothetical protein
MRNFAVNGRLEITMKPFLDELTLLKVERGVTIIR